MEPRIAEVAGRIRALREDMDLTMQEMADATGRSVAEYAAMESGEADLSFTFLYRAAERFGVDMIELLTGENPHLTGYSVVRSARAWRSSVAKASSTATSPPPSRARRPNRSW